MGGRAPRSVSETKDGRSLDRLTILASGHATTKNATRPPGRDHRCPETDRAHANAPTNASQTTPPNQTATKQATGPSSSDAQPPLTRLLQDLG